MSFRGSGNLLILHVLCVHVHTQFPGVKIHQFFLSDFQRDPQKDKEPLTGL